MPAINSVAANPIPVADGGTGVGTLTGVLIGNGTSAITAVTNIPGTLVNVTGVSQAMAIGTSYISNNSTGLVTFTLPASASLGDAMQVFGKGPGGWQINQNASQAIRVDSQTSTTGTGGSVSSSSRYNSITLTCIVGGASTIWNATNHSGALTVT